ncbi:MAG: hypothetical protein A2Y07_00955 [Planctomycetes bacterium GWF2_50_10]|nr:MAG: hypothetical protein A2Y07_00955 [Planctomycetes bacterium GWF2_50_10]
MRSRIKNGFVLGGFIVVCELAGVVGSFATMRSVGTWYKELSKPWFAPADWVFGPVWTALFAVMGVAAWLVWREREKNSEAKIGLIFFFVQLGLNVTWSFLFFGARSPGLGFKDIILLWAAIAITMWFFFKVSRWAGGLMIPYLLWVSFAAVLNFAIWRMN